MGIPVTDALELTERQISQRQDATTVIIITTRQDDDDDQGLK